jgi:hypothetical protein
MTQNKKQLEKEFYSLNRRYLFICKKMDKIASFKNTTSLEDELEEISSKMAEISYLIENQ